MNTNNPTPPRHQILFKLYLQSFTSHNQPIDKVSPQSTLSFIFNEGPCHRHGIVRCPCTLASRCYKVHFYTLAPTPWWFWWWVLRGKMDTMNVQGRGTEPCSRSEKIYICIEIGIFTWKSISDSNLPREKISQMHSNPTLLEVSSSR